MQFWGGLGALLCGILSVSGNNEREMIKLPLRGTAWIRGVPAACSGCSTVNTVLGVAGAILRLAQEGQGLLRHGEDTLCDAQSYAKDRTGISAGGCPFSATWWTRQGLKTPQ